MIPLRTDSPLRTTPWTNWVLIVLNVLGFLAQRLGWFSEDRWSLSVSDPHLVNYFTYQFLHGDGLHIAGNMLFLYIFGNNVNDRMGNWGYLAFYLAGGVFAGIAFILFSDPFSPGVIGASGSIAAITGAYLVLLPTSRITVLYWFILIGVVEIPSFFFVILYFVMDFVYGFAGSSAGGVAHTAHIGGSVFGFSVSFALLATSMLRRDQFDLFALFQRWNRRRQYQDMVSRGYDPFGVPAQLKTNGPPDPRFERVQDLRAQISEAIAHHKIEDAARIYLELHAIDPQQVLSRQNQLDVANQLFAQGVHGAAADAYEAFIRFYPKYEQIEQVLLMLGLLYARYLNRPDRAREHLNAALPRLSNEREIDLARTELSRLAPSPTGS
jgi:membrane associated rhomboid family serine protease